MNIADLALVVIWLFFFIRGYFRGLVHELGALAALVSGFYLAKTYHGLLTPYLSGYISGNNAGAASYILIFALSLFAVWMLVLGLAGLVKMATAQWADRLFGGAFGLIKGVVLTAAILFLYDQFAASRPEFLTGSKLVPHLDSLVNAFAGYAPKDLVEKVNIIKS